MGTQTDSLLQASEHGSQIVRVLMTLAAGADGTIAHTFTRAFKAAPKPIAIVRTVGGTAQEAVTPMISALSASAFTLAGKGTHAADASYYCTFEGSYI
jgi:hypothetical protein